MRHRSSNKLPSDIHIFRLASTVKADSVILKNTTMA